MSRGTLSRPARARPRATPRGGDRTRHRILKSALRLFSREGFHGTSIRTLAGSVGLTEAAIYYHFPSKRSIIRALYEERGFMAALDQLEQLPGDVPLAQQLAANAFASARLWDENADLLRVVIAEVLRGDATARTAHRELMDRWLRGIAALLARYQDRGSIDPRLDVSEATQSWVNLMFGTFMDRLLALGRSRSGFLAPEFCEQLETAALAFGGRLQVTEASADRE